MTLGGATPLDEDPPHAVRVTRANEAATRFVNGRKKMANGRLTGGAPAMAELSSDVGPS